MPELKTGLAIIHEVMERVAAFNPVTSIVEYARVRVGDPKSTLQYVWQTKGVCSTVEVFYELEGDGKQIWEARYGENAQQFKFSKTPPLEQLARVVPKFFELTPVAEKLLRKNGRKIGPNDVVVAEIWGLGDSKKSSGYGSKLRYIVPKEEYMNSLSDAETQFRQQLPCPGVLWQLHFSGKAVSLFVPDISVTNGQVQLFREKYIFTQSLPENPTKDFEKDFNAATRDVESGRLLMAALRPSMSDLSALVDDIERGCAGSMFPRRRRK